MRRYNALMLAGVVTLCLNVGVQGEPSEPADPPKRAYVPTVFFDHGAKFPPLRRPATDAEPDSPSLSEEVLFGTHSFRERGIVYNIEFYYRKLYERMRVRVLVGQQELHGLFNRLYGIKPDREITFWVSRSEGESIELTFNFAIVKLNEFPIDTDAIYDAAEAFLSRSPEPDPSPSIRLWQPPGLLKKTCWVRISARSCGGNYLINERGQVDRFTMENLRVAYNREQIKAQSLADYERIGRSLIAAENDLISQCKIIVISRVEDIPGYQLHPLDAQSEAQVKPAWLHTDADTQRDHWTCFTYRAHRGVVARYTFGFQNGDLHSAEKTILAEGIGKAYYIHGERLDTPDRPATTPAVDNHPQTRESRQTWLLGMLSAGLITAGALLLLVAYVIRRRTGLRSSAHHYILLFLLLLPSGCGKKTDETTSQASTTSKGGGIHPAQTERAPALRSAVHTSLHQVVRDGNLPRVRSLIAEGCGVNAKDRYGYTPLHYGAWDGHKDIVELLVAHGADATVETWVGDTPLHCAAERGRNDIVELLIAKGANVNAKGNSDRTALHHAARLGNTYLVEFLLANGAEVNAKDRSHWLPLHGAAQQNAADIAEILIAHGANVNCPDHGGFTPLHIAAEGGHRAVAEFLIGRGAEVNALTWSGTPLHAAVDGGHEDLVELLIAKGADVTIKNDAKETAIDLARHHRQAEILNILTGGSL